MQPTAMSALRRPGSALPWAAVLACSLLGRSPAVAAALNAERPTMAHPKRWLLVSQPSSGDISYASLPRGGFLAKGAEMKNLVNGTTGLSTPLGIAVDQLRRRLFVTDPVKKEIVAYNLIFSGDPSWLSVSAPTVWADNTEARWVAVDTNGDIFYTDEANNQILTVGLAQAARGDRTGRVLYDGSVTSFVSAPGGIAVDGVRLYWVNKQLGSQFGSVVSAPKVPIGTDPNAKISMLAANTDTSYGLCIGMSNLFYTQPDRQIFGLLASGQGGGNFATITDRLMNPRGCTFDGDGTIYVADRGAGAVYSYAGNMQTLGPALVQLTATAEDVFDAAVFSRARGFISSSFALAVGLAFVSASLAA